MATAAQLQYTLTLPVADKAFFTELLKKTRWTAAPVKSKTTLSFDKSMQELKAGKVHTLKNTENPLAEILS